MIVSSDNFYVLLTEKDVKRNNNGELSIHNMSNSFIIRDAIQVAFLDKDNKVHILKNRYGQELDEFFNVYINMNLL